MVRTASIASGSEVAVFVVVAVVVVVVFAGTAEEQQ